MRKCKPGNDANKIVKDVAQEKSEKQKFETFFDLANSAMEAKDTNPTEDEPQTFNKAWHHPILSHKENGKGLFKRSLATRKSNRHKIFLIPNCRCIKK